MRLSILLILPIFLTLTIPLHAQTARETYSAFNRKAGKWGIVQDSPRFRWIIPAIYDSTGKFSEGRAPVKTSAGWGFVDLKGSIIVNPQFEKVTSYSQGFALVSENGRWGVIDSDGAWVIKPQFETIYPIDGGAFRVSTDEGMGCIFPNGKWACPPKYRDIGTFSEGRCEIQDGNKQWGFLDEHFQVIIPCKYQSVGSFTVGLAPAQMKDSLAGYLDKAGNWKIKPKFFDARPFQGPYSIAYELQESFVVPGIIDTLGNWAILPSMAELTSSGEPGFFRREDHQWKFAFLNPINPSLNTPTFDGAGYFQHGFVFVCMDCKWVYNQDPDAYQGGRWALMDTALTIYELPSKLQADFRLNETNTFFGRSWTAEMHTQWLRHAKRRTVFEFINNVTTTFKPH
jgi:hypothetical protein